MAVNSDVAAINPAIERDAPLPVLVLYRPARGSRDDPPGNVGDDGRRPGVDATHHPQVALVLYILSHRTFGEPEFRSHYFYLIDSRTSFRYFSYEVLARKM